MYYIHAHVLHAHVLYTCICTCTCTRIVGWFVTLICTISQTWIQLTQEESACVLKHIQMKEGNYMFET